MPSTTADTLRELVVIPYARVSSLAQGEKGLSNPGQLRELREWAARRGYRVLEEVEDKGGKDSKRDVLDRPGINRILYLVERGGVDLVIAQSSDRIGERWIPDLLSERLRRHGTRLCVLDKGEARQLGQGGGEELLDLVKGWHAGEERREMARRSRSRKLEKARQGYVVSSHTPPYGFEYTGGRQSTTLAVVEERMAVVKRIFRMVGVEGCGIRTVARRLDEEGIPTPPNKAKLPEHGRRWNRQFLRDCVLNPVYKPHTLEELARYVARGELSPEVFDQLSEEEAYGLWRYEGRDYGGDEHAVAVPVVGAGIPREWVDGARDVVEKNVADKASSAGGRGFWELSRGILVCGGCGDRMATHSPGRRGEKRHRYYRCPRAGDATRETCPVAARLPAERTEEAVWRFVADLRTRPEQMLAGLDHAIEEHQSADTTRDARALYGRLEKLAKRRIAYQEMRADGDMTREELRAKLGELEEAQEAIRRELDSREEDDEVLRQLEQCREELAACPPEENSLDTLREWEDRPPRIERGEDGGLRMRQGERRTPEERREVYQGMRLEAVAHSKTEVEVRGLLFEPERVYVSATSRGLPARYGNRNRTYKAEKLSSRHLGE